MRHEKQLALLQFFTLLALADSYITISCIQDPEVPTSFSVVLSDGQAPVKPHAFDEALLTCGTPVQDLTRPECTWSNTDWTPLCSHDELKVLQPRGMSPSNPFHLCMVDVVKDECNSIYPSATPAPAAGSDEGTKIGAAVGGTAALLIAAAATAWYCRRKHLSSGEKARLLSAGTAAALFKEKGDSAPSAVATAYQADGVREPLRP